MIIEYLILATLLIAAIIAGGMACWHFGRASAFREMSADLKKLGLHLTQVKVAAHELRKEAREGQE